MAYKYDELLKNGDCNSEIKVNSQKSEFPEKLFNSGNGFVLEINILPR